MLGAAGITVPLTANTPQSCWLPELAGFVKLMDAMAWFKPSIARLSVVWYKLGLLAPLSSTPKLAPSLDRKSTRLNSSHLGISYAVFCLKKKQTQKSIHLTRLQPAEREESAVVCTHA